MPATVLTDMCMTLPGRGGPRTTAAAALWTVTPAGMTAWRDGGAEAGCARVIGEMMTSQAA
jgi:hypothetical protein